MFMLVEIKAIMVKTYKAGNFHHHIEMHLLCQSNVILVLRKQLCTKQSLRKKEGLRKRKRTVVSSQLRSSVPCQPLIGRQPSHPGCSVPRPLQSVAITIIRGGDSGLYSFQPCSFDHHMQTSRSSSLCQFILLFSNSVSSVAFHLCL